LRAKVLAQSAVVTKGPARLAYEGPRTVEGLWADPRFRLTAPVVVQRNKVMRTRPIFPEWQATIAIDLETSVANPAQLAQWLAVASAFCGLGDWRPRYGRFMVTPLDGASSLV
jgi:hypothetical protein